MSLNLSVGVQLSIISAFDIFFVMITINCSKNEHNIIKKVLSSWKNCVYIIFFIDLYFHTILQMP